MELEKKIIEILAETMELDEKKIFPQDKFVDDLGMDSLDAIELAISLEEEYDIQIPDKDIQRLDTIEDLASYIRIKKGANNDMP